MSTRIGILTGGGDCPGLNEAFHRRHGRGVSYSIAIVAEGAKPIGIEFGD
jgi:hypothetical protein